MKRTLHVMAYGGIDDTFFLRMWSVLQENKRYQILTQLINFFDTESSQTTKAYLYLNLLLNEAFQIFLNFNNF